MVWRELTEPKPGRLSVWARLRCLGNTYNGATRVKKLFSGGIPQENCDKSETWRIQKVGTKAVEIGVGLKSSCDKIEWEKYPNYGASPLLSVLQLVTLPTEPAKLQNLAKSHGFSCFLAGDEQTSLGKTDFLWLFQHVQNPSICRAKCDFVISGNANVAGVTIGGMDPNKEIQAKCSFLGVDI